MEIAKEHYEELKNAKLVLENPGFAVKIVNLLGMPIEKIISILPERANGIINDAARKSMLKALDFLTATFKRRKKKPKIFEHKIAAITSGAIGGFFGIAALAAELPASTLIILRSILEIAQSEGEDISDIEAQLACMEVFAFGGSTKSDEASEFGYYAVRGYLAKTISEAAKYIAQKGIAEESAPLLIKFIAQISSRFGIVVTEKAAAQALPIIGAATGAAINAIFISHFQNMAKGHFTIRKLERIYGEEVIEKTYDQISNSNLQ